MGCRQPSSKSNASLVFPPAPPNFNVGSSAQRGLRGPKKKSMPPVSEATLKLGVRGRRRAARKNLRLISTRDVQNFPRFQCVSLTRPQPPAPSREGISSCRPLARARRRRARARPTWRAHALRPWPTWRTWRTWRARRARDSCWRLSDATHLAHLWPPRPRGAPSGRGALARWWRRSVRLAFLMLLADWRVWRPQRTWRAWRIQRTWRARRPVRLSH